MENRSPRSSFIVIGVSLLLLLVALASLFGQSASVVAGAGTSLTADTALTSHASIRIDSDQELAAEAAVEHWPGNGSLTDPYIIENLKVNGTGSYNAIFIGGYQRLSLSLRGGDQHL